MSLLDQFCALLWLAHLKFCLFLQSKDRKCQKWPTIALISDSDKQISPHSLAFKMQFANIFVEKFSGKQRWKEYQKYLQKFEKMRIGGEFWARLVMKPISRNSVTNVSKSFYHMTNSETHQTKRPRQTFWPLMLSNLYTFLTWENIDTSVIRMLRCCVFSEVSKDLLTCHQNWYTIYVFFRLGH